MTPTFPNPIRIPPSLRAWGLPDLGSYTSNVDLNRGRLAQIVPTATAIIGTVGGLGLVIVSAQRRAPHNRTSGGTPGLLKNLGAAAAVVFIVFAFSVVIMAWTRDQRRQAPRSAANSLLIVMAFVVFVLLVSFLVPKFRRSGGTRPSLIQTSPQAPAEDLHRFAGEKPVTWGYQLGFALVVLMVLIGIVAMMQARRARVVPLAQSDRRTLISVSLDDLLVDIDNEKDPRRAVLLADHGMEVILAQHGLPRLVTETAQEHVQRVATELSLSTAAAHTLTTLYGQAHFGSNEITHDDRRDAIVALRSVRDDLRERPSVMVDSR